MTIYDQESPETLPKIAAKNILDDFHIN